MKHFLLPENFKGENKFLLDPHDSHYLINVLRYKEGDIFDAVDREGASWKVKLLSSEGKQAEIMLERNGAACLRASSCSIILYQCLPKGKKMDLIVRQATEAGVTSIRPLYSEFSLVKYDEKGWKSKEERYIKIAREALQQSGGDRLPSIDKPVQLTELEKCEKDTIALFFHQESIEKISLHKYLVAGPDKIAVLIGPEGGLSGKEISYLRKREFNPVFLGDNVLRTETAALYAVAAVKTILLEKDSWMTV